MTVLLFLLIITPLISIAAGRIFKRYNLFTVVSSLVNFIISIYLFKPMLSGERIEVFYRFSYAVVHLQLDLLSFIFIFMTSIAWLLSAVYARDYLKNDLKQARFYIFFQLTLSALMGLFLSGDFFTIFIFFEIMTLASYVLVIHKEDKEAREGGYYYLFMGVMGGLLILWGIVLMHYLTGGTGIKSLSESLSGTGNIKYLITGLMITGFGIKAGMVPVHIWLPRAHPVAPTPASALLSGIIIKAGSYGILRIIIDSFWQVSDQAFLENVSISIMIIGSITMLLGMIKANFQWNVKKLLAYSSISQMGYILTGIGAARFLGHDGINGYLGGLYHIINHSLFKTNAFLITGIFYYLTKKLDLREMSGSGRRYPLLMLTFAITLGGISGIPGFNGYISKTLIHHGILEVMNINKGWLFFIIEKIYIITSIGSLVYFLKIFFYIFIKKPVGADNQVIISTDRRVGSGMKFASISFSALILFTGLFPELILNSIMPVVSNFSRTQIENFHLWSISNLLSAGFYLIAGLLTFLMAVRFSWFNYKLPSKKAVQLFYTLTNRSQIAVINALKRGERLIQVFKKELLHSFRLFKELIIHLDRNSLKRFSSVTLKNLEFSKLIVATILAIIMVIFFLF